MFEVITAIKILSVDHAVLSEWVPVNDNSRVDNNSDYRIELQEFGFYLRSSVIKKILDRG